MLVLSADACILGGGTNSEKGLLSNVGCFVADKHQGEGGGAEADAGQVRGGWGAACQTQGFSQLRKLQERTDI